MTYLSDLTNRKTNRQNQRGRLCRIEELESRDMLSAMSCCAFLDSNADRMYDQIVETAPVHENHHTTSTHQSVNVSSESNDSTNDSTGEPAALSAAPLHHDPVKPKVKVDTKASTLTSVTLNLTGIGIDRNAEYAVTCADYEIKPEQVTMNSAHQLVISGLDSGTKYKFSVAAKNTDGNAADTVFVTAKTAKYGAVKGFKVVKAETELSSVMLTWKPSSVKIADDYNVEYEVDVYHGKGKNSSHFGTITLDAHGNVLANNTELIAAKKGNGIRIGGLSAATKYTFAIKSAASDFHNLNDSSGLSRYEGYGSSHEHNHVQGHHVQSSVVRTSGSTAAYDAVKNLKLQSGTLSWNSSKHENDPAHFGYEVTVLSGGQVIGHEVMSMHDSRLTVAGGSVSYDVSDYASFGNCTFQVRAIAQVGDDLLGTVSVVGSSKVSSCHGYVQSHYGGTVSSVNSGQSHHSGGHH
jgi:hypothetical protein